MAKMYSQLAKLTLVTSFGKGSDKPLRKATSLIFMGLLAALMTGYVLSKSLQQIGLAGDIPTKIIFITASVTIFIIVSFILLPLSQKLDSKQSINSKNLRTLPLSKMARWFVAILPITVVSTMLTLLFLPILLTLDIQLNTSTSVLLIAYFLGLFSSIGLVLLTFMTPVFKFFYFICLSATQLYFIDRIIKSTSDRTINLLIVIIVTSLFISSLGIAYRYFRSAVKNNTNDSLLNKIALPTLALKSSWYSLKVLRNKKTFTSVFFCLIVSVSLVTFSYFKKQMSISPQGLIIFASVLTASLTCDFRGISRHYKTPEILTLKNVTYFVNSQIRSSILTTGLIIAPVTPYLLKLNALTSLSSWLYFLSITFAGSLAGLLSSSIFVPESGEVGSQFISSIFALSVLFGVPKIFKFNSLDIKVQAIAWLCLAGLSCMSILLIEDNRLKNYGRI
jgi:hypothetical protein